MRAFLLFGFFAVAATQPQSCQPPTTAPNAQSDGASPSDASASDASRQLLQSSAAPGGAAAGSLPVPACASLLEAAPRGLACLHCLQPEAATQADALAEIVAGSCLKNVVMNYLVDGSFTDNTDILYRHISLLTSGGRQLLLHLYLMNGPAQRRYARDPGAGFGADISPAAFRERIQSDTVLQDAFKRRVAALVPVMRFAAERGAVISIVPMLEDNLTEDSFSALSQLVLDELPRDIPVSLGRNACGCSTGSDEQTPVGFFKETHDAGAAGRFQSGIVTNDGVMDALDLPEGSGRHFLSLDELVRARDDSQRELNAFILWGATRQGLYPNGNGGLLRQEPAKRSYAIPDETQRSRIVAFLRGE